MIYPHNSHSKSAKALAKDLKVKLIKREGSAFRPNSEKTIINWGCRQIPKRYHICTILNSPQAVTTASNKLLAFQEMNDTVRLPLWTANRQTAKAWQLRKERTIIIRNQLTGHGGAGIQVVSSKEDLPEAPLYTRYIPKNDEYRVHVMFGKVVDTQKKARRYDVADEDVDWQIRNYTNGFIYMRENFTWPKDVEKQALAAVKTLQLEWGAVDVIWNDHAQKAYVLEVNTAPGLEGQTLKIYANVLKGYL